VPPSTSEYPHKSQPDHWEEGRRGEERGGEGRRGEERGGGREKGRGIALIQTTGNIFLAAEYGEGAECVYFLCF